MYKKIFIHGLLVCSLTLLFSACSSSATQNLNNGFDNDKFTFKIDNDLAQKISVEDKREFCSAFIRDFIKQSEFANISSWGYPSPAIQFYDSKNASICKYTYILSNDLTIDKRIEGCKRISNITKLNELIAYSKIVEQHILENLNKEIEKYSKSDFDKIYDPLYAEYFELSDKNNLYITEPKNIIDMITIRKINEKVKLRKLVSANGYSKYDMYFKHKNNLDIDTIKKDFLYDISFENYNNTIGRYRIHFDSYELKNIYFKDLDKTKLDISKIYFNFIPISFISENIDIKVNIRTVDNGYKPYALIFLNKAEQSIEIKKITIYFDGNIIDNIDTNIIVPTKTATKMILDQNKIKSDKGFRLLDTKNDSYKYGISIFYTISNSNKTLYDIKDFKIDDFNTITIMTGI